MLILGVLLVLIGLFCWYLFVLVARAGSVEMFGVLWQFGVSCGLFGVGGFDVDSLLPDVCFKRVFGWLGGMWFLLLATEGFGWLCFCLPVVCVFDFGFDFVWVDFGCLCLNLLFGIACVVYIWVWLFAD